MQTSPWTLPLFQRLDWLTPWRSQPCSTTSISPYPAHKLTSLPDRRVLLRTHACSPSLVQPHSGKNHLAQFFITFFHALVKWLRHSLVTFKKLFCLRTIRCHFLIQNDTHPLQKTPINAALLHHWQEPTASYHHSYTHPLSLLNSISHEPAPQKQGCASQNHTAGKRADLM